MELLQDITDYLSNEYDLISLMKVCKWTHKAINHPSSGIWRTLFRKRYDSLPKASGTDLKVIYQARFRFLQKLFPAYSGEWHQSLNARAESRPEDFSHFTFETGTERDELKLLPLLRALVLGMSSHRICPLLIKPEARSEVDLQNQTLYRSNNQALIRRLINATSLVENTLRSYSPTTITYASKPANLWEGGSYSFGRWCQLGWSEIASEISSDPKESSSHTLWMRRFSRA